MRMQDKWQEVLLLVTKLLISNQNNLIVFSEDRLLRPVFDGIRNDKHSTFSTHPAVTEGGG